jgi:hypothetical protein
MIADIGLMIGAYIVFRVLSEWGSWETEPSTGTRAGLTFVGIGVLVVVGACLWDIFTASSSFTEALKGLPGVPH